MSKIRFQTNEAAGKAEESIKEAFESLMKRSAGILRGYIKVWGGNMNYQTDYALILEQLKTLLEGERDTIANLANASALLNMCLADINWVGFYLVRDGRLVLGPFQGRPACRRIDFGKGVCGAAAAAEKSILVENVHEFAGHIACDSASNSEIVVPVFQDARLTAVLDIDSPLAGRFTLEDQAGLEQCAALLGRSCDWKVS